MKRSRDNSGSIQSVNHPPSRTVAGKKIFISYARADDEAFVTKLYQDLSHSGIEVWWDRESMESRGRTFLQEIRDAIAADSLDRVVLVVGPAAARSEVVRAEWGFALEACRIVVPVLRIGESALVPTALAGQDFKIVPDELSKLHTVDFRPARDYGAAMRELLRILKAPVPPLASLHAVEALPPHFLARAADLSRLQEDLLVDLLRPEIVTPGKQIVGLSGMGGIGKTVLASAFARSCPVRRAFEQVAWLRIGQAPNLFAAMRAAGKALGDTQSAPYMDSGSAVARLAERLASARCLLVLDDVWEIAHVAPFRDAIGGTRCRLLLTTRNESIVTRLGAINHRIDVLEPGDALALLAEWHGKPVNELPAIASRVAAECGGLPLALAMVGAMTRGRRDGWDSALHRLQTADLAKLHQEFPNYPYPDMLRALRVSVDALRMKKSLQQYPGIDRRYGELAVFPSGSAVPETAIQALWSPSGLSGFDAQDYLVALAERSLLRRSADGKIMLHDLQADYLRAKARNLGALHRRLLDAYARAAPKGWASGPDDGYFFQALPHHLVEGRGRAALEALLFDYEWLRAKLAATDALQLAADFDLYGANSACRALQQALRLSASHLAADASQLAPHLWGRLAADPHASIRKLLAQAARNTDPPWLQPRTTCLSPPGGALQRVLNAGEIWAVALAQLPTGELACGSHDGTVYVWNLNTGRRRELHGHDSWVEALIVTPDGRLISGGADGTLREWDLEGGESKVLLTGRRGAALALMPGGAIAGAGYADGLWVWDPESGKARVLAGHGDKANLVTCLPDGRLVSAGRDNVIHVWDSAARTSRVLRSKHEDLEALIATHDGKVLVGGKDGAIVEIDPDTFAERIIARHDRYIDVLALSPVDRLASATHDDVRIWPQGRTEAPIVLPGRGVKALLWLSAQMLAAACYDGKVRLFNADQQSEAPSSEEYGPVRALGVTDSGWVIVRREQGPVLAWHYGRGTSRAALEAKDFSNSIAITADGAVVYDSEYDELTAFIPGAIARQRYPFPQGSSSTIQLAAIKGSRLIAADPERGVLNVWDRPGVKPRSLATKSDLLSALQTDRSGQLVVSSYDGSVRLWNRELTESRLLAKKHKKNEDSESAVSVAISESGRWVAAGFSSGIVRLWNLRDGGVRSLYGHLIDMVTGVAFLSDDLLVSGGFDSTLRLWDLESGEQLAYLALESHVSGLVIDRAGTIVVGDHDGRTFAVTAVTATRARARRADAKRRRSVASESEA